METGVCKFCGQIIETGWLREISGKYEEAEPDYLASRLCTCPEGRQFNEQEEAREDAEERRAMVLESAKCVIEELFGVSDGKEIIVDEDVRALLYELATMVYDTDLSKAQLTDRQGVTAKIKLTSRGRLSISRSESNSITQEA